MQRIETIHGSETVDGRPRTIIHTTLFRYPGWKVVHNVQDGTYWASSLTTDAIGPSERTFWRAVEFARSQYMGEPFVPCCVGVGNDD